MEKLRGEVGAQPCYHFFTFLKQNYIIAVFYFHLPHPRSRYEAVALAYGAAEVVTIEYNARASEDPRLAFLTPAQFAAAPRRFDAVISISSFEHDGLGRYGDPLDGSGDLKAMRNVHDNLLVDGGLLYLAVPMGPDVVVFNAHRIYGPLRWPLLTAGWEVVDSEGFTEALWTDGQMGDFNKQPVFVLKVAPLEDD